MRRRRWWRLDRWCRPRVSATVVAGWRPARHYWHAPVAVHRRAVRRHRPCRRGIVAVESKLQLPVSSRGGGESDGRTRSFAACVCADE